MGLFKQTAAECERCYDYTHVYKLDPYTAAKWGAEWVCEDCREDIRDATQPLPQP
jgi:hypothetical protein